MELSERRQAPRFQVQLKASAGHSALGGCPVKVSNISQSGLQFEAEQAVIPLLIPKALEDSSNKPQSIRLKIEIPQIEGRIKIDCGIVYVRRSSREHCLIGCRFEGFEGESAALLEGYLSQLAAQ